MKKAVIFDLDGTLADTLPAMLEAINRMLDEYGEKRIGEAKMRTFINGTIEDFVRAVLPAEKRKDDKAMAQARAVYEKYYAVTYRQTDHCYDGIPEVLSALKREYRLAILSNKQQDYVERLNEQLFPGGMFALAVGAKNGIPGKPAPDSMRLLLRELGFSTEEVIYVGDSDVDLLTARNAGTDCVCVSWGYRGKEYLQSIGAEHIADTPAQLYGMIDAIADRCVNK